MSEVIVASTTEIVSCPDCGVTRSRRKGWPSLLCRSCAQKGERGPAWKGGIRGEKGSETRRAYNRQAMRRLRAQWRKDATQHKKIKIRDVDAKRRKLEVIAGRPCPEHCEICGKHVPFRYEPYDKYGRLYFDHDHKTGNFRGWLCRHCNSALGLVSDNPEILKKMIAYLEKN